ncbi:LysR family transcriptional regulator [Roseococcus sp. DSY-14]|uniref:LysR family transcriptional regulator n=1 Tax=Roseococcus sp. DSY-14 TaxID=3369650 RepID=UPI00387B2FDD
MAVEFKALETFVAVATLRSFGGGAARLRTTQPAVSQRIAALEEALGRRLLDRSARRVVPTEAGRLLLEHAERLLAAREEMLRELGEPAALSGTLRLGVSETVVHTFLSRFVERLAERHPRLQLEVEVDVTPHLRARVEERALDLAFLVGPLAGPGLAVRPLRREALGFFAAPALGLHGRRFGAAEMARQPLLTFARQTAPYAAVHALLARHAGRGRPRIHTSHSLATLLRMAAGGIGVAVVPPAIAREEVAAGRLVALRGPALPPLDFVACWRAGPRSATAAAAAAMAAEVADAPTSAGTLGHGAAAASP